MNMMKELEMLAHLLPGEEYNISELSQTLKKAINTSDGNLIKINLSNDILNADMTRVTVF